MNINHVQYEKVNSGGLPPSTAILSATEWDTTCFYKSSWTLYDTWVIDEAYFLIIFNVIQMMTFNLLTLIEKLRLIQTIIFGLILASINPLNLFVTKPRNLRLIFRSYTHLHAAHAYSNAST
jgi:hypothetical protein